MNHTEECLSRPWQQRHEGELSTALVKSKARKIYGDKDIRCRGREHTATCPPHKAEKRGQRKGPGARSDSASIAIMTVCTFSRERSASRKRLAAIAM